MARPSARERSTFPSVGSDFDDPDDSGDDTPGGFDGGATGGGTSGGQGVDQDTGGGGGVPVGGDDDDDPDPPARTPAQRERDTVDATPSRPSPSPAPEPQTPTAPRESSQSSTGRVPPDTARGTRRNRPGANPVAESGQPTGAGRRETENFRPGGEFGSARREILQEANIRPGDTELTAERLTTVDVRRGEEERVATVGLSDAGRRELAERRLANRFEDIDEENVRTTITDDGTVEASLTAGGQRRFTEARSPDFPQPDEFSRRRGVGLRRGMTVEQQRRAERRAQGLRGSLRDSPGRTGGTPGITERQTEERLDDILRNTRRRQLGEAPGGETALEQRLRDRAEAFDEEASRGPGELGQQFAGDTGEAVAESATRALNPFSAGLALNEANEVVRFARGTTEDAAGLSATERAEAIGAQGRRRFAETARFANENPTRFVTGTATGAAVTGGASVAARRAVSAAPSAARRVGGGVRDRTPDSVRSAVARERQALGEFRDATRAQQQVGRQRTPDTETDPTERLRDTGEDITRTFNAQGRAQGLRGQAESPSVGRRPPRSPERASDFAERARRSQRIPDEDLRDVDRVAQRLRDEVESSQVTSGASARARTGAAGAAGATAPTVGPNPGGLLQEEEATFGDSGLAEQVESQVATGTRQRLRERSRAAEASVGARGGLETRVREDLDGTRTRTPGRGRTDTRTRTRTDVGTGTTSTTTTFTDQNFDNPVNNPGGPGFPTGGGQRFQTTRRVPIPDPPDGGVGASRSRVFEDEDEEVFSSGIRSPEEILGTADDGDGFTINEDDFSL